MGELVALQGGLVDHHFGHGLGNIQPDDLCVVVMLLLDALQVLILDRRIDQKEHIGDSIGDNDPTNVLPSLDAHENATDDGDHGGVDEMVGSSVVLEHKFYYSRLRWPNYEGKMRTKSLCFCCVWAIVCGFGAVFGRKGSKVGEGIRACVTYTMHIH